MVVANEMNAGLPLNDAYARVSAALVSEGGVGAGGWAALLEYYKTLRFRVCMYVYTYIYVYHTYICAYMYVCVCMSIYVSICISVFFCRFALMELGAETTGMAWAARAVCDAGSDAVSLLRAAIDAASGASHAENNDLGSREVVPLVVCIQKACMHA